MTSIEKLKTYGWNFEGRVAHKEWKLNIGMSDEPYIVNMQIDLESEEAYFSVRHKNIERRHEVDFKEALLYVTKEGLFKDLQNPFKEEIILSFKDGEGGETQITKLLNSRFKSIILDEGSEEYFIKKLKKDGISTQEIYEKIDKTDVDRIIKQNQIEKKIP